MRKLYALTLILSFLCLQAHSSNNSYKASKACKEFIKSTEKCSLTAYWDANGYSIGYGHHTKDVRKGQHITKAHADKLFAEDISKVEAAANKMLAKFDYKFSQGFFDGLCDLIYNCGEGGVKSSVFWQRLNKCRIRNGVMDESDYKFTIAAVKTMRISAPGHVKRRAETYKMMKA